MTIQSWLWLAVCKWCRIQEIHIFKLNKIYLHSRHYFTSSNCIFMQLQGIVFIQLQGNYILVNCQGNIDSFKLHIFVHKKYNHSSQLCSDTKLYSFQGTVTVRSRKYILVQRNIFIQGNYINSKKYIYLRNIYSFKFKAICRLGIQPLFGDEPMFSPRKTAGHVRLGSCHWRQQPNLNMRIYFQHFTFLTSLGIYFAHFQGCFVLPTSHFTCCRS